MLGGSLGLTPLRLGTPLLLTARCVAFFVASAALLLGLTRTLTGVLLYITRGAALLGILGRP
jgi:hypothetical protein